MPIDSRQTLRRLPGAGAPIHYYSLAAAEEAGLPDVSRLPFSLKCVLENLLRQHAEGRSDGSDVAKLADWLKSRSSNEEIGFCPTRMIMPESSGLPLFGDLAAMRDAMAELGGDPAAINPVVPVDVIVDHSGNVDAHGQPDAVAVNLSLEIGRNGERYRFLRWAAHAFDNLRLFPPGVGICHQINLEYLARVVWTEERDGKVIAFPDSLVGMDSHTPMINSMGIVGWGVGGLEGGSAALGQPVSMLVPSVVGVRLRGHLPVGATATDLVLTITERLRQEQLQGMFIEYTGDGLAALSLPDRATVANMTPECGATMGFFPIDRQTLAFLRLTGRPEEQVALVETYARAQGLWHEAAMAEPDFTQVVTIDLDRVVPSVSGPSKPQQRVGLDQAARSFTDVFPRQGDAQGPPRDGDIVIAAMTSCTNTSNPSVMLAAGLLARNAVRRGLRPPPWVKTSLAPGSLVVADYLRSAGLQADLDTLGFNVVGFGCTTCMGNSGPLLPGVAETIARNNVAAVAVLSGNRNFEGRVHTSVRANYLASPPLVVAYALCGSILLDLTREPLGTDNQGAPVMLSDIWPSDDEVLALTEALLTPQRYRANYLHILEGSEPWRAIEGPQGIRFDWGHTSSFIRRPPFFDRFPRAPKPVSNISGARVLAVLGDMVTTDHISPIGVISPGTPADQYLQQQGIQRQDYVNYAARRLNHDVMIRGTFANIRLRNEMTPGVEGSSTLHQPDGRQMSIPAAAELYRADSVPLVIVAGREYGAGSSRDWAAKGTFLLGVRAVIAESFERIHRSNLVGMGVLPLEFMDGATRATLAIDGSERFDIGGLDGALLPRQQLPATITRSDGRVQRLTLRLRLDTSLEVQYFKHGGILPYVLRDYLEKEKVRDTSSTPSAIDC